MKIKRITAITLKICILLGLLAGLFAAGINIAMYFLGRDSIVSTDSTELGDADCIIVLGAGVRADGSPSHMLEDRLLVGIELYDLGVCDTMLMSGDHGRAEYDEVNTMKKFATERGVPAERIFMDHAGFSTYESLYRAKEIFGAEKVIIVTQEYHLYRALYIARSLGLDAVGVSADLRGYSGQVIREVREVAARVKDYFYTVAKPLPTYLGEPISLDGSGDVTNDQ